jgi:predicted kinase
LSVPPDSALEVVVLVGLPGAGKSTFYRQRFADSHTLVSKDLLPGRRDAYQQQAILVTRALSGGRSVVVDNTNATPAERLPLLELARAAGARTVAYFFAAAPRDCAARNRTREGRARVPDAAIFITARRLVPPTREEGFDALHTVHPQPDHHFDVT